MEKLRENIFKIKQYKIQCNTKYKIVNQSLKYDKPGHKIF